MENKREILKVVDLQKKFHKLEVLKGISTTFHENEVVSIIGPSGGGKSTFLRCLNLLEQPTSGQILFDGTDICTIKGKAIDHCRQRMGMVFQQFNLFNNMNVLKNITLAPVHVALQDLRKTRRKNFFTRIANVFRSKEKKRPLVPLQTSKKQIVADAEQNAMRLLGRIGLADKAKVYPSPSRADSASALPSSARSP